MKELEAACRKVIVVGRDAELWLAAGAISRALGPAGVTVEAVELESKLPHWAVYPTLPPLEALHRRLGIDESRLIRETGGTFSLGWSFGDASESFFHAWGAYGQGIDGQDFLPCWLRANRLGLRLPYQDFSLGAVAARLGRVLVSDEDTARFGRTDYAYHLPAHRYAALLKAQALSLGVTVQTAAAVNVEEGVGGRISALHLNGDRLLQADLFVDTTGADALLRNAVVGGGGELAERPLVDRVLSGSAPRLQRLPPFASVRASEAGWTALFPTQMGTQVVHAYSTEFASDEEAIAAASSAAQYPIEEFTIAPISGRSMSRHWVGNVVALGASAAPLDPMHGADLHALQLGVVHLLELFPASADYGAESAEYNRVLGESLRRIRDYQDAYYRLNSNKGAFWECARSSPRSAELDHRIATFMARGEVAPMEYDSFSPDSWRAMLIGLRVLPESWPPAVDLVPAEVLGSQIHQIIDFIRSKVLQQADHGAQLKRIERAVA
ncbi:MAG TPA: tryptophan 7-halogenase [Sphingomicrobium sp.]|nr:tryptophan 7-halogenase [Sphingomicrobium sp.]